MPSAHSRPAGRPTLEEVAARAGVGRGTVSRVVNGSPQVSPRARAAVEAAIAELGYVPNRAARSLVTRRTDSVALVISESEERLFGEPFFAGIVRGILGGLAGTPLQLWLAMASSPAERDRLEGHLTTQHVDGVMLLSMHGEDPLPKVLLDRGMPTVLGGRSPAMAAGDADPGLSFVDVDNASGARQAVTYLAGAGRRRIATIAGPQDMGVGVLRLAGYREALRAAGLPADEELVGYGDFTRASGMAGMARLLERAPDLDAVFAASDLMAAGALRVLREHGRRVPADVAVVGFEDSFLAEQTEPMLTSVHQAMEEMGRAMARLLVSRVADPQAPAESVLLPTHLVRRASA